MNSWLKIPRYHLNVLKMNVALVMCRYEIDLRLRTIMTSLHAMKHAPAVNSDGMYPTYHKFKSHNI